MSGPSTHKLGTCWRCQLADIPLTDDTCNFCLGELHNPEEGPEPPDAPTTPRERDAAWLQQCHAAGRP